MFAWRCSSPRRNATCDAADAAERKRYCAFRGLPALCRALRLCPETKGAMEITRCPPSNPCAHLRLLSCGERQVALRSAHAVMTCTVHPLRCASVPPTCCAPFRLPTAWTALWRYVMVRGGESMIASGTHRQRAHGNTVTSLPGTPSRGVLHYACRVGHFAGQRKHLAAMPERIATLCACHDRRCGCLQFFLKKLA